MAVKTSVNRLAKAVSTAVREFATQQGWSRDDYKIIAIYHPDRELIYLTIGSTQPVDRARCTEGLMNSLAVAFGSRSWAFNHVVPIVRHLQSPDKIEQYLVLHDNEVDMTDML